MTKITRFVTLTITLISLCLLLPSIAIGQNVLYFKTDDPGETKAIYTWGIDTAWPSIDNMRQGLTHMGADETDSVRMCFYVDDPLTSTGELGEKSKRRLNRHMQIANMAGDKPWALLPATEDLVHEWYKDGDRIRADRWVALLEATQKYLGKPVAVIEPFNEPDWGWGQGSPEDLRNILQLLQKSPHFKNAKLGGPATLNSDAFHQWYSVIKDEIDIGSTHTLAGSFDSYVDFIKETLADGHEASNPEAHSVVEAIIGAEYGLHDVTWWGAPFRSRGLFVKSCQGKRLAYLEDREAWSAAAVYRAPDGVIRAFAAGIERQGTPTSYRFIVGDRAVYFDGQGPTRVLDLPVERHAEEVIEVAFGHDIPPVLNGQRFVIVNRATGKALQLSSLEEGSPLEQSDIDNTLNQEWDVARARHGYYTIKSAKTRKAAAIRGWNLLDDGEPICNLGDGGYETGMWDFEYLGDGWFHIRNNYTCKLMIADGNSIVQSSDVTGEAQQWRLFPADYPVDFDAPEAPSNLKSTTKDAAVALTWDDNGQSDISKYTIYRSAMSGGPYDVIAESTTNSYTDPTANKHQPYYYVVRATDHALNPSDISSEITATPSGKPALIAHLEFENNTRDSSENGFDAIIHGSPMFAEGKFGRSIQLDGRNEYLSLPQASINSEDFTFAVWVYWFGGNWVAGPTWQRLFDFGYDTEHYMFLTPQSNGENLRFAIKNGGDEQRLNAPALERNKWTHLAVVLDGDTGKLYINGKLADKQTITIDPADLKPITTWIGKSTFNNDPMFLGRIDDLRIYNHALSESEIKTLGQPR